MKVLTILILIIPFVSTSQKNSFLRVNVDANLNIYLPYTSKSNEVKSPFKINSFVSSANLDFCVFSQNKWSFYTGVSYKYTRYLKKDGIGSFLYQTYNGGLVTGIEKYTYSDPADLVANSHALGTSLEIEYRLKSEERYTMSLGFKPSVYFLEWYNASYESLDILPLSTFDYHSSIAPQPLIPELPRTFFLSSINAAATYRITLLPKTGRTTFTGKLSLGANIYSDWEQFKRYAWLGVGLEIGFLGKEKNSVE